MPNDDLISRKALYETVERYKDKKYNAPIIESLLTSILCVIENAPAVDAEPVRRARLLSTGYDEAWCEWGDCTNCGKSNIIGSKYCCKCGAYLEKER